VLDALADEDGQVRFAEPEMKRKRARFYRIRPLVIEAIPLDD